MSTQTKSKLFILIIAILLLTNIAMLYFLFTKDGGVKPPSKNNRDAVAKEFLQKEIGFTPDQMQQYDTLAKLHREKMKSTFDEMRSSREEQFKDIGRSAFSDSSIAEAITISSGKQKMMEMQFYNHMLEVRKICTTEQLPKFDSLFYKMWSRKPPKKEEKK